MKKGLLIALLALLAGCSNKDDANTLKVAASAVPQAQMLQFVKPMLEKEGVHLKIIEIDDYNIPNRALSEKEIDANFFQHVPFMDEQIKAFGYKIKCYGRIHLEPMGLYSKKVEAINGLKEGAIIAIPSDPTNEYRALALLQKNGLITLKKSASLSATIADIQSNPKKFKFREVDAAMLSRTFKDVDLVAIPTNYALQAGLNPSKNALALEGIDSPYDNIIAILDGTGKDPRLEALKKVMLSEEMRTFILHEYNGAIIPVLKPCQA